MFLKILRADGTTADIELATVGGSLRFAIGAPGHRSSVWTVAAGKKRFDVYIASAELGRLQKFSLHESGRWRYAWLDNVASDYLDEGADRAIDKWERAEFTDAGWIPALAIECRDSDLSDYPADVQTKSVGWIPAPPEGMYASLRFSVVKPDSGMLAPLEGQLVGAIRLPNDWAVLIVGAMVPVQPDRWAQIDALFDGVAASAPPVPPDRVIRIAVFGSDEGTRARFVWETGYPLSGTRGQSLA